MRTAVADVDADARADALISAEADGLPDDEVVTVRMAVDDVDEVASAEPEVVGVAATDAVVDFVNNVDTDQDGEAVPDGV